MVSKRANTAYNYISFIYLRAADIFNDNNN